MFNWLKRKYNKKKNKFQRTKFYKFVENVFLFMIVKTKFKRLPSSLSGHYPIESDKNFYKIVSDNLKFFEYEKNSIKFIKENYPEVAGLIPDYKYYKNYFKTVKLLPIKDVAEQLNAGETILRTLKKYGKNANIELDEMYHIVDGLSIIKYLMGEDEYLKIKDRIQEILKNNQFRIGICHGDFHSKNLVKNQTDFFMIDLDCFREKSIQEFDAIYFMIQYIVDIDKNIWWYESLMQFDEQIEKNSAYKLFIEEFLDFDKLPELEFLYFIDRIGQDAKYIKNYDELPKSDIIKLLTSKRKEWKID